MNAAVGRPPLRSGLAPLAAPGPCAGGRAGAGTAGDGAGWEYTARPVGGQYLPAPALQDAAVTAGAGWRGAPPAWSPVRVAGPVAALPRRHPGDGFRARRPAASALRLPAPAGAAPAAAAGPAAGSPPASVFAAGACVALVGFAAVMLLSGGPAAVAQRAPSSAVTSVLATGPGWPAALSRPRFAGGLVTINAIASSDGVTLAAGSANGYPAVWAERPDGSWSLELASSSALWKSTGAARLTGLAHGPAGWLAVGETGSGRPVIITSSDGITWRAAGSVPAFAGQGLHAYSAAANGSGYVVAGAQSGSGRAVVALWWSADLRSWTRAGDERDAAFLPGSAAVAAAAIPSGFAAAGTRDGSGAIWTSSDGRLWAVRDVPRPAGTAGTVLLQVAGNGDVVAAAGYAAGAEGRLPLVAVSADGGRHWRQALLAAPGGTGEVTTVTAAGGGFIAAGQAGRDGRWQPVTWTSADGVHWSQAEPAPPSTRQITAMTLAAGSVTGAAIPQDGGGPVILAMPAP